VTGPHWYSNRPGVQTKTDRTRFRELSGSTKRPSNDMPSHLSEVRGASREAHDLTHRFGSEGDPSSVVSRERPVASKAQTRDEWRISFWSQPPRKRLTV
jgi:hypothetical protein